MSFTEAEHPRATDGKFAEKTGAFPEVSLTDTKRELMLGNIQQSIALLSDASFEKFPLSMQESAIAAVNSREADDEILAAADELAEACESWNFHDTSLKLRAGISRKHHAADPDAPLDHPYALAYDPSTPPELLRRVRDEGGSTYTYAFLSNGSAPSEFIDEIAGAENAWMRQRAAAHPNISSVVLQKLMDDDDDTVRDMAKAQMGHRNRMSLAEHWEGRDSDEAV
jgi:hypothetical protein